ncbi:MAG: ATP-binding protein [Bacteroidales bacterium]|nr:ATP-binding protein [Bacteroidales bacterium]MCF8345174.1 ATP-binding protein [Bacteroidales bacterium]MCF8350065.1 ATP-binding protein [Bacteroidales bacterium]MCF8374991.1 ATP-binding protein [Bacteroidales bacterium]
MILKDELERVVLKQQDDLKKYLGTPRRFKVKIIPKFATIITGVRRGGKSTLVRQYLQSRQPVYYLYFEDIALAEFELKDFSRLENIYYDKLGEGGVYFFDEIQLIEGWEKYIRQLVDSGQEIIITGSTASMLSKELGTRLTGRHISLELYPFSYREFLDLEGKQHSINLFEKYLEKGGFPEYLKSDDVDVLRNLFQDIFYRDVLHRNLLRNEIVLKSLLHFLISNIGKEVSFNKLKNLVKAGSVNSISQFIDYFEQAYLLFSLKKFDYSLRKQMMNPKKIYCIDNAIIGRNAFSFSENKGRMLENLIFLELKRKGQQIFYHRNKSECDFVVQDKLKITQAIQVCYELDNFNQDRELGGLMDAMNHYDLKKGLIITFDQEDQFRKEGKQIHILPAWKWLS